jgi:hypothetical protein
MMVPDWTHVDEKGGAISARIYSAGTGPLVISTGPRLVYVPLDKARELARWLLDNARPLAPVDPSTT